MRSRYGDDDKVSAEFFSLEQRAAAMAKELKELKAGSTAQATATPATPQPTTQAQPAVPAVRQETTPQPEHPAVGESLPDLEQRVSAVAAEDSVCVSLRTEYANTKEAIKQFVAFDASGKNIVGGALPELDKVIHHLENQLDPKFRETLGLPELDEFTRAELDQRLRQSRFDHSSKMFEFDRLVAQRDRQAQQFDHRVGSIRQHFAGEYESQRQEAEREARIEADAQTFVGEFKTVAADVFSKLEVPAELHADIIEAARVAGVALLGPNPDKPFQLREHIERVTKKELEKADTYHRIKYGQDASLKRGDAAGSAPKGAAAVASPLPADDPALDWREKLEMEDRAYRKSLMAASR